MKAKTFRRIHNDSELGEVEQYLRVDENGEWTGWEVYDDGLQSAPVDMGQVTTLPLGFREISHAS